ncbi:MAG: dihydroneopterin aldolase [Campylobacterota bacterium]
MKKKLTININRLKFKCIIGILDFERVKKQKVIINLSFDYEYTKDYFIDYSKISKLVKKELKNKKFKLIEDAIIHIETKLYKKYKIENLHLNISKPDILKDCIVSVGNK